MQLTLPDDALLKIDEVAAILRISVAKAYAMAQRGELPTVKMGKSVRVRRDRLMAWLDSQSH